MDRLDGHFRELIAGPKGHLAPSFSRRLLVSRSGSIVERQLTAIQLDPSHGPSSLHSVDPS